MKRTKKPTNGVRSPWTLGELVMLAYDVAPNRRSAVKLLGALLGGQAIQLGGKMISGG